jgi:hypothetical protein
MQPQKKVQYLAAVTKISSVLLPPLFRFCYTARGGFCFPEEAIQEFHGNRNYRHAFSFSVLGNVPYRLVKFIKQLYLHLRESVQYLSCQYGMLVDSI